MVRPRRFEIRELSSETGLTLAVVGELDLSTVPELDRRLAAGLRKGATHVTLDLGELTFMDSSGLRLLIELGERAEREPWRLELLASRHEAANLVLRMTGADGALPFAEPPS